MADEILKSRHAFGSEAKIQDALTAGAIDAYDILFLDEKQIGWIDKNGEVVIAEGEEYVVAVESLPESGETGKIYVFGNDGYIWNGTEFVNMCKPTDLTELQAEIAKKADAEVISAELDTINADVEELMEDMEVCENTHEKVKYEFTDVPVGTLVSIREDEIRVMCPATTVWEKQTVGEGGDANCYYATFKTYSPSDDAVGYIEHLGDQVDAEILTDLKTDKYGRKYQPSWLALAKYNEESDAWTYYGAKSTKNHYIGWDYQIDWYNADGVMIASDSIRINLSNEDCHSAIEPYFVGDIMKTVDAKIEEKIAEVSAVEVVEF